jgi:heat shock protein HslJ
MIGQLRVRTVAFTAAVLLLSGGVLAGCSRPEEEPGSAPQSGSTAPGHEGSAAETAAGSDNPLAGTNWRLVEFQSMDDATGTIRPDDPSLYTMHLNADGTVNMRLNCNRANGSWSAEPGADGESGRFEFGPLATTRALCPPPSLDEQIAAQADYVRSYLLRDGRLHLSLMADGGIYVWEPRVGQAEVPVETEPDAELEAAIRGAEHDYTPEMVDIGDQKARYLYSRVDLDGDGTDEVFVYLLGPFFCGTGGCDLLLFTGGEMGYNLVNTFPISRVPVIVSPERTAGWSNLIRLESGGGAPPSYLTHTFDGQTYVERERVVGNTAPEGTRVLAGEVTFDRGIPLEPRN